VQQQNQSLPLPARLARGRVLLLALAWPAIAGGQPATGVRAADLAFTVNDGDLVLSAVSDLSQDPFKPKLGNGSVAVAAQWPASLVAGTCTATLIGPQVLITAAHCVGNGAKVTVKYASQPAFTGVCTRHESWSLNNLSPDVALCLMAPMAGNGLYFESVDLDPELVGSNQLLLLGGYGCRNLDTQKIENPPLFRIGYTVVAYRPGQNNDWPNWAITQPATARTSSFACPGDSGGSVYHLGLNDARRVVGIISAVNANKDQADYKASYLTALAAPGVKQFITSWPSKVAGQTPSGKAPLVCGIDSEAPRCRPDPP